MKQILLVSGLIILTCGATYLMVDDQYVKQGSIPVDHSSWDKLLKKHVNGKGWVSYKGFMEDVDLLDSYLNDLSNHPPDPEVWKKEERLAYWINAYNAFTIKLITDHYPLESIRDIQFNIPGIYTVWDREFFKIGGKEMSLDEIEHEILRKEFDEPRIHFAIVCASISCPALRNEAFRGEIIDRQLQEQGERFINDPSRNVIRPEKIRISKIFSWFSGDFTREGSLIDFLNRFSNVTIQSDARIEYLDYDWGLNGQK